MTQQHDESPEDQPEVSRTEAEGASTGTPPQQGQQATTSEDTAAPEAPSGEQEASATATDPEQPSERRRRGVPAWLLAVAAIIPAAIVGIAVYFAFAGGDEDSGNAAGIVDGLIRLGGSDQSTLTSYEGELPPDFTTEFPTYEGAEVVVSISIASEEGTSYFIVMSTEDTSSEVYRFYSDALDQAPWQVEIGRASDEFTGLRFLRPDNIDVSGDITLYQSALDDRTAIYLSYDDVSQSISPGPTDDPVALGATRPLPPGFPDDVPVYDGEEESIVLDTYFERGQGGQAFVVTFLTRDTQDEVIDFYTQEFEGRGWNVTEPGVLDTSFALSIEFDDGEAQSLSGSITANSYDEDPAYTQVDLLVTVSSTRGN